MEPNTTIFLIATSCVIVYLTARLIFAAYFTARSTYIRQILEIAKEIKDNG